MSFHQVLDEQTAATMSPCGYTVFNTSLPFLWSNSDTNFSNQLHTTSTQVTLSEICSSWLGDRKCNWCVKYPAQIIPQSLLLDTTLIWSNCDEENQLNKTDNFYDMTLCCFMIWHTAVFKNDGRHPAWLQTTLLQSSSEGDLEKAVERKQISKQNGKRSSISAKYIH